MAYIVRPADIIKSKVIDYLIGKYDDIIIGNEVMCGTSRKIVDLLALYRGNTYAIEIKSGNDDLRRLPEQLAEYSKIFDYTVVFTTTEHIKKVLEIVKKKTSVYEVAGDEIRETKLVGKRNYTHKNEMLATMNSPYIRKRFNIINPKDSDIIRRRAIAHKKEEVREALFDYFKEKLYVPYKLFLKERGDRTEIDDIMILSNRLNVE